LRASIDSSSSVYSSGKTTKSARIIRRDIDPVFDLLLELVDAW
jgi:hypothetical protein